MYKQRLNEKSYVPLTGQADNNDHSINLIIG